MTKYRFRKQNVSDGVLLDLPADARGVRIHSNTTRPVQFAVLWLEEVPLEIEL